MELGKSYHLAKGLENLFKSEESYLHFLRHYNHFINPMADALVWSLMPSHIRYLFQIKPEEGLSGMYQLRYPDELVFKGLELLLLPQLFKGFEPLKSSITKPQTHHDKKNILARQMCFLPKGFSESKPYAPPPNTPGRKNNHWQAGQIISSENRNQSPLGQQSLLPASVGRWQHHDAKNRYPAASNLAGMLRAHERLQVS